MTSCRSTYSDSTLIWSSISRLSYEELHVRWIFSFSFIQLFFFPFFSICWSKLPVLELVWRQRNSLFITFFLLLYIQQLMLHIESEMLYMKTKVLPSFVSYIVMVIFWFQYRTFVIQYIIFAIEYTFRKSMSISVMRTWQPSSRKSNLEEGLHIFMQGLWYWRSYSSISCDYVNIYS